MFPQQVEKDRTPLSSERSPKFHFICLCFPSRWWEVMACAGRRGGASEMWFYELFNWNVMNLNEVKPECLWNWSPWQPSWNNTDEESCSVIFSVSAHTGGPHRGRVVIPDERQHYYQRLHWSHTQGLERRDRRMYPHPLWAYLNRALHAPTREKVWANHVCLLCNSPR